MKHSEMWHKLLPLLQHNFFKSDQNFHLRRTSLRLIIDEITNEIPYIYSYETQEYFLDTRVTKFFSNALIGFHLIAKNAGRLQSGLYLDGHP